jgi:phosphoenolpyruvate carboxykinase (GTP)
MMDLGRVNRALLDWVEGVRQLCRPSDIYWCDGSEGEYQDLCERMVSQGTFTRLNNELRPASFLARSHPSDVARIEDRTFVCTSRREDAGPTNNWMDPREAKTRLRELFSGAMVGRTMFVIPFCMGPTDAPLAKFGVEITDSPYVAVNMRIMARVGDAALGRGEFVPCLHSMGAPLEAGQPDVPWPCEPDVHKKYVAHFPEDPSIWSYGSGYGGNALLGKKCLALRIASYLARDEGWLAEHMLIMSLTSPQGVKHYLAGAFPSACGKTNLAMMRSTLPGWKVTCLGDDVAWMWIGSDGRLWAMNPENGFFGVAPGTSAQSNPNAMATISRNTVFTNVALTANNDVWWEGMGVEAPEEATDWRGNRWSSRSGTRAAHPNARFTAPVAQCPTIDRDWNSPQGVPISAILLGGRRATTVPLVVEAFNWEHGVFMGSSQGSETTSAALGQTGILRRDPFAMLPFCGYNMSDYFAHWLSIASRTEPAKLPRIYSVNWFRTNREGAYLWPGYGDNVRVLKWIHSRLEHEAQAEETCIGYVPYPADLDLSGLDVGADSVENLLKVDPAEWKEEVACIAGHYDRLGERLPHALRRQLGSLEKQLSRCRRPAMAVAAGRSAKRLDEGPAPGP